MTTKYVRNIHDDLKNVLFLKALFILNKQYYFNIPKKKK